MIWNLTFQAVATLKQVSLVTIVYSICNMLLVLMYMCALIIWCYALTLYTIPIIAIHRLNWAVTFISSFSESTELSDSIKTLTFTLARHPFFSPAIFLPPILTSMGGGEIITAKELDQSLADSDILQEYMQRSNLIGWRTRNQFEELWMQLLGVLNTPMPDDGNVGNYY